MRYCVAVVCCCSVSQQFRVLTSHCCPIGQKIPIHCEKSLICTPFGFTPQLHAFPALLYTLTSLLKNTPSFSPPPPPPPFIVKMMFQEDFTARMAWLRRMAEGTEKNVGGGGEDSESSAAAAAAASTAATGKMSQHKYIHMYICIISICIHDTTRDCAWVECCCCLHLLYVCIYIYVYVYIYTYMYIYI